MATFNLLFSQLSEMLKIITLVPKFFGKDITSNISFETSGYKLRFMELTPT